MAMLLHVPKMGTPCPLFEKRGLRRTVSIKEVAPVERRRHAFRPADVALEAAVERPAAVFGELKPFSAAADLGIKFVFPGGADVGNHASAARIVEAESEVRAVTLEIIDLIAVARDPVGEAFERERTVARRKIEARRLVHVPLVARFETVAPVGAVLVVSDIAGAGVVDEALIVRRGFADASHGLRAIEDFSPNLVLLDVMMPKMNGLSALMKIREKNNIPIIMLSAKTEESDKVIGLSMGADDYVTKPYNTAELMARVKSQLRRYFSLGAANGTTQSQDILKNGGLLLNRNTKELLVDGEPVRLTATEYKIMELLMEHPGYVFSAEEIYSQVWQEDAYSVENTVMVHIRRIREKIEITPKNPKYLKVVWGIGYKIEKIDGN